MTAFEPSDQLDRPSTHLPNDAQSDPEPAVPSLPQPDPGVFHPTPQPPTESHRAS